MKTYVLKCKSSIFEDNCIPLRYDAIILYDLQFFYGNNKQSSICHKKFDDMSLDYPNRPKSLIS
jgi:hypothetical protein